MAYYSSEGAYAYVSTPAETTCTNADEYYLLVGTFNNEILDGFIINADVLTYKGNGRRFEIKLNASLSSDAINNTVTLALFKNGVLQSNSEMTAKIESTTGIITIPVVDVISMVEDDYIDIRVKSDLTGSGVTGETVTTSAQVFHK